MVVRRPSAFQRERARGPLHSLAMFIGGAETADSFVLIFAAGRAPPLWLRSSLTRNLPGFNRAGALERVHDFFVTTRSLRKGQLKTTHAFYLGNARLISFLFVLTALL